MLKKILGIIISLVGLLGVYIFVVFNNTYIWGIILLIVSVSFFIEILKNKKFNSFDVLSILVILSLFTYSVYSTTTLCCVSGDKVNPPQNFNNIYLENYTDDKYGYSVGYPENWLKLPNNGAPNSITYLSNGPWGERHPLGGVKDRILVMISVKENPNNLSLDEFAQRTSFDNPKINEVSKIEDMRINGINAIRQIEDSTNNTEVEGSYVKATYLQGDGIIYVISSTTYSKEISDLYINEYEAIINSFRLN